MMEKIKILYNCIDTEKFEISKTERNKYRHEIGLKEDDFVVMYSGRITEEKGVLELARAIEPLCRCHSDIKLLVVGCCWFPNVMESQYMDSIKKAVSHIEEQVVFTGFIEPVFLPKFYMISDVYVQPTLCQEAFGISVLEAMASGKAVIVTKSGGLTEVVDKSCSVTVDLDNNLESNLRDAIKMFYEEIDLIHEYGNRARNVVKEHPEFSKNNYYKCFLNEVNG